MKSSVALLNHSKGKSVRIDHVMIVTADAEREFRAFREVGLGVVPDSSFDGLRNAAIPLESGQYLEILWIDGEGAMADWARGELAAGRRYAGWGVEVESVGDIGARLDLPIGDGAPGEDGNPSWQHVESVPPSAFLPFFITYRWTPRRHLPEQAAWVAEWVERAAHAARALEISGLDLVGDPGQLATWVGGTLPVNVRPGSPEGLEAIRIRTDDGELVLPEAGPALRR